MGYIWGYIHWSEPLIQTSWDIQVDVEYSEEDHPT